MDGSSLATTAGFRAEPLTDMQGLPEETRLKLGITPSLIRLSVGIEDVDDLLEDLDQALKAIGSA